MHFHIALPHGFHIKILETSSLATLKLKYLEPQTPFRNWILLGRRGKLQAQIDAVEMRKMKILVRSRERFRLVLAHTHNAAPPNFKQGERKIFRAPRFLFFWWLGSTTSASFFPQKRKCFGNVNADRRGAWKKKMRVPRPLTHWNRAGKRFECVCLVFTRKPFIFTQILCAA